MRVTLTESLARAIAHDVANEHARAHGRDTWNAEDYNVAVAEFDRLWTRRQVDRWTE